MLKSLFFPITELLNLLWESEKIKLYYNYGLKMNLIYKQENFNVQSVYCRKKMIWLRITFLMI